jgi:hypothetical protein
MKTVYCPIKRNQINGDDCYLLCAIADLDVTSDILPDGVEYWNEAQRQKCLQCKYHEVLNDSKGAV